jgi:hypothetical protein
LRGAPAACWWFAAGCTADLLVGRLTYALGMTAGLAALAGCGSNHTKGTAKLWVTRDRGRHLVLAATVKAGQTAMQALQGKAKVKTSYGGRFVESIDGVSGSRSGKQDWFYFVNGYEADRGAADYTLHPGDVEWWDYRSWKHAIHVPVVVGAFPEPFLHGYAGKRREATIVFDSPRLESLARRLASLIHAKHVAPDQIREANVLYLTEANVALSATTERAGGPVRFAIGRAAARRLLSDPRLVRFRYSGIR